MYLTLIEHNLNQKAVPYIRWLPCSISVHSFHHFSPNSGSARLLRKTAIAADIGDDTGDTRDGKPRL